MAWATQAQAGSLEVADSYHGLTWNRMPVGANWRRLSKFEEVKFIFPTAPKIPITIVRTLARLVLGEAHMLTKSVRMEVFRCRDGTTS